jgi:hypothetical protein
VNRDSGEKIIFPRIGSFEIYIYNILISSKLISNQWPNHYKILQLVAKVIEEKKNGNSLQPYSVYSEQPPLPLPSKEIESPERKNHRIVSKKKKMGSQLTSKAYKSIEKGPSYKDPKSTLEPLSSKLIDLEASPPPKNRRNLNLNRYLESKADNRAVKLPSLNTSLNVREDKRIEEKEESRFLEDKDKSNTIEEFSNSNSQINPMPRKFSEVTEGQKISLLELRQESFNRNCNSLEMTQ